jgi:hypothetical protein
MRSISIPMHFAGAALLALAILAALALMAVQSPPPADAQINTTRGTELVMFRPGSAIEATDTIYTPLTAGGVQIANVQGYSSADVFVSTTVASGTAQVVITPQVSPNGSDWYDLIHPFVNSSNAAATVELNTLTINTVGGAYTSFDLDGRYLRFEIVPTNVDASNHIDPEILVTLR